MYRIVAALCGLQILGSALWLTPVRAEEPENHENLVQAMGWMVGTWEDAEGPRTFKWDLGQQVITWTPEDPDTARAMFYWDPTTKQVKAIAFGAAGWRLEGNATDVKDKQITFSIVNFFPSGNKVTGTLSYALRDTGDMAVELKTLPAKDHDETLPAQKWTLTKAK